jgi:P-type Cu2+ transporter
MLERATTLDPNYAPAWEDLGLRYYYEATYSDGEGEVLGAFAIEDEIRPESYEVVRGLHRLGIPVAMITGDSKTVANSVAQRIGIDEVAAEVLPADKASAVRRYQAGGKRIAMVGDGVK